MEPTDPDHEEVAEDINDAQDLDDEPITKHQGNDPDVNEIRSSISGTDLPTSTETSSTDPATLPPVDNPLTPDLVSENLSLLARTGNGLSFAYTRLEIHGKGLTSLDVLESFPHLRYIDLSDNAISDITVLSTLTYLLSLDLHKNTIKSVPTALSECKYLQQLNLSKNEIGKVEEFPKLGILAWFNLNDNRLKEVNLEGYYELIHFECRGNLLSSIPNISTPKLQRLYLGNNHIKNLKGLEDKHSLITLHLRDNKIESFDGLASGYLKSLAYLNLRGNQIDNVAEVSKLSVLPSLKVLVLQDNPVDQIPNYRCEIISKLPKLDRLDKQVITDEEREETEQFKQQQIEEAKKLEEANISLD
ncbi:Leucine-rich repeat-containing protein 23 [Nowakowskiella sp. JEL0407]|nr:Leucine-rich repeat-containing protein 23 [Nowakowskiella sp. JEL0407]